MGDTENFVYEGTPGGAGSSTVEMRVLRITHRSHRSTADLEAELDFVRFLAARGQPVCSPILASDGREWHAVGDEFIACCFERARGERVVHHEPRLWNELLFEQWGRTLAHFHECARVYDAPDGKPRRCLWFEDDLLAGHHLTAEHADLSEQLVQLIATLKARPPSALGFGLIHADLHSNNFFVGSAGALSVFDFDDACQHWFSFDLAVVADQLPRDLPAPARQAIWTRILAGYRQVSLLPDDFREELALMLKLRALQLFQFMHKKRRASESEVSFRSRIAAIAAKIRADEPFDLEP